MNRSLLLAMILQLTVLFCPAQVTVVHLLTENRVDPIGLDTRSPRFSWRLQGEGRNILQTAYEISMSTNGKEIWNSGMVSSPQSAFVGYGVPEPRPGTLYSWRVRVRDNRDKVSAWSSPATWSSGMMGAQNWKAQWIEPASSAADHETSPLLRKSFQVRGGGSNIRSATLYITAHGLYESFINGKRVGKDYLTPGWTSYKKRLQYQVYDVAAMLQAGKNTLGVTLANGWYRGNIGYDWQKDVYGKDLSLLCQLVINYRDGRRDTIVSGPDWRSSVGEVHYAEIYNGQVIDHRQDKPGWTTPGYDDSHWDPITAQSFPKDNLVATTNEPVRLHESFAPVRVFRTPKGEQVIDFGQNLVGWVRVRTHGSAGDSLVISHAEVLDKAGNFYTENLRKARARDTYILQGGEETFEPHFTFHGFRFIRIEGLKGNIDPADFTAFALYSDMPVTGEFSCSNPLVNQLQHNIRWSQRGNFLDIPTDCPQRDERLGWTGDAQVFSRTAAFNMGVDNFMAKWLKDMAADQRPTGSIPFVIPNVTGEGTSAGWADAATIIPWNMYLAYGDRQVLQDQYPSMKAWVEYMRKQAKDDLWNTGFHFGDWLFYRPFDDNDGRSAVTDKYLIAQCFYAHSTQLLIDAATVLGKQDDATNYGILLKKIKAAFVREYMTPDGRLVSGTQTAYTLALQFDLFPEPLRPQAAERLVRNIVDYGYHLTTGFLGTPYLCHVLSRFGYTSVAYRLLLQDTYPSWLYPVKMGATTIWERWDGERPDSTFQTPGMNSFNHYSYGAIGDWMYRIVAGIDTYEDGPGYLHSRIYPHPGGGLQSVSADLETNYGRLASHWRLDQDSLFVDVVIPPNTHSTVHIPVMAGGRITESGHTLASESDIKITSVAEGILVMELGSGEYHFKVEK
jgi:alpha-L-rhamnosidase